MTNGFTLTKVIFPTNLWTIGSVLIWGKGVDHNYWIEFNRLFFYLIDHTWHIYQPRSFSWTLFMWRYLLFEIEKENKKKEKMSRLFARFTIYFRRVLKAISSDSSLSRCCGSSGWFVCPPAPTPPEQSTIRMLFFDDILVLKLLKMLKNCESPEGGQIQKDQPKTPNIHMCSSET